jgi:hypothetical protein
LDGSKNTALQEPALGTARSVCEPHDEGQCDVEASDIAAVEPTHGLRDPTSPDLSAIVWERTRSLFPPRRRASSFRWIDSIELRNRPDPAQCFVFLAPLKTNDLGRNALADRLQTGVRNHEPQLAQTSSAPPLAHHPHSFDRSRHFDLLADYDTGAQRVKT